MPGSSLWLVPPHDSQLHSAIHHLILDQIPPLYPNASPRRFIPHITLTADTISNHSDPQHWLDGIILPDSVDRLEVLIQDVQIGSPFFRKLSMACEKTPELCELAVRCRVAGVEGEGMESAGKWVEESYEPHCSLMYSDVPEDEVRAKVDEVNGRVEEVQKRHPGSEKAKGGYICLVPTYKEIEDWKPVASRWLPGVEWEWYLGISEG